MPVISSKFTNPVLNVVFSSFKMKEQVLDEKRIGISWYSLSNYDLITAVNVIKDAVRDQSNPKNIVVQVLQNYLGFQDVQVIIDHMYDICELVKNQTQNKLAFGTALIIPSEEKSWSMYGLFNKECQVLNERMSIPRVNLHRSVMSQISASDLTLRIRPACWEEFQLGLGVGTTLSAEGMSHLLRYIQTVFDTVFSRNAYTMRSRTPKVLLPPSLACTPGYFDNLFYMQVLEDKRIIRPRPRSTGGERTQRFKCTDKRLPGWRSWAVFRQHGPLWNFNCREGILEAHLILYTQSDEKPIWSTTVEPAEVIQVDDNDESDDEDSVFLMPNPPVPHRNYGTQEKKTQKKSIQNDDNDRATELLQIAKDKVHESERLLTVTNEKIKSYKKDLVVKDAQIAREKAAVKHWRAEADKKQAEYDEALTELYKLQVRQKRLEDENDSLRKEYDLVSSTFKYDREGKKIVKVTRKFVAQGDVEKFSKKN